MHLGRTLEQIKRDILGALEAGERSVIISDEELADAASAPGGDPAYRDAIQVAVEQICAGSSLIAMQSIDREGWRFKNEL